MPYASTNYRLCKTLKYVGSVDTADSFFLTFTSSRPFRRGTPSSPVENCKHLPIYTSL